MLMDANKGAVFPESGSHLESSDLMVKTMGNDEDIEEGGASEWW
jgi:hypothetical protein